MSVLNRLLLHGFAKSVNIFLSNTQSYTQILVGVAIAALRHQLFYHILVGRTDSSSDTNIYAGLFTKSLDIIWSLSSLRNLCANNRLPLNRLQRNIRNDRRFTAV